MIPPCEKVRERVKKILKFPFPRKRNLVFKIISLKTWKPLLRSLSFKRRNFSLRLERERENRNYGGGGGGISRVYRNQRNSSRKVSHRGREREREKNNFEKIIEKLDENILRIGLVHVANFFSS